MRALVTGGAGFIGSHLVDALVDRGDDVIALDDLSTGRRANLNPKARFVEADLADLAALREALEGVEVVFHQGARTSVPRSVEDPLGTDRVNVHGTLAVLHAAREAGCRRVVYASSSSVYGGASEPPTPESAPTQPRSPYAVSKLAGEWYCRVFAELHGLETVSLRYFNVFGPRQRPDSPYAAVIPRFVAALVAGEAPTVYGDGLQSRDFTYVDDVVAANLAAASAPPEACRGDAYNVGAGDSHTLLELLAVLGRILATDPRPVHADPRPGDVRHSGADVRAAARHLGYAPRVSFEEGLRRTVEWFTAATA